MSSRLGGRGGAGAHGERTRCLMERRAGAGLTNYNVGPGSRRMQLWWALLCGGLHGNGHWRLEAGPPSWASEALIWASWLRGEAQPKHTHLLK
jgi:hypothetical protein